MDEFIKQQINTIMDGMNTGLYEYSYPPKDVNGDTIENFDDWYNQRTEYLDNLIE